MVGWRHRLYGHEFEQTPGGSAGQGIFQARVLEWGATAFSNGQVQIVAN